MFVEAELPGVKHEDLEISVVGNDLTLSGQRAESQEPDATYLCRERAAGTFTRAVRLPVEFDAASVSAALNNGVLLTTLPKAEARLKWGSKGELASRHWPAMSAGAAALAAKPGVLTYFTPNDCLIRRFLR